MLRKIGLCSAALLLSGALLTAGGCASTSNQPYRLRGNSSMSNPRSNPANYNSKGHYMPN